MAGVAVGRAAGRPVASGVRGAAIAARSSEDLLPLRGWRLPEPSLRAGVLGGAREAERGRALRRAPDGGRLGWRSGRPAHEYARAVVDHDAIVTADDPVVAG